ncbi:MULTISPECIES: aminoglycoside phosphotransferase family protein [unclassified Marinovum]
MTRNARRARFLLGSGHADWACAPLAGDASSRRYERLTGPDGQTVILMDADPATCGPQSAFLHIRTHLFQYGFSAPVVFAQDIDAGFLVLEDFGDALFASVIQHTPALERPLYTAAADLLARLHTKPLPPGMAPMTARDLATMIEPAFKAYAPACAALLPEATSAFEQALRPAAEAPAVLSLRDFHAENMIYLSNRNGDRQVGLLDFQDAFATHPAYDLVSMLQDARRDLSPGIEEDICTYFTARTGTAPQPFEAAYAALGAQRNLRILGIFSNLAKARNKPQYLALQPRVWHHLQANLSHPTLADLRKILAPLPAPEVTA